MAIRLLAGEYSDLHRSAEPGVLKPDQLIRSYRTLPAVARPLPDAAAR